MAPRLACPNCGTKKWRKKAATGALVCSSGHILQDYRNEASDTTYFGPHDMRKRTLKSTRATKENKSFSNPILYHGDRARYHYFQCLQVLLRMQITKLIKLWELPTEFEIVCRDTWALHLSLLSSPPPPEPYFHSEEQDIAQEPDFAEKAKALEKGTAKHSQNDDEAKNVSESSDTESSFAPDNESEADESSGMDNLLREASEVASSDSEEDEQGRSSQARRAPSKKRTRWRGYDDSPAATICILVHSCWLMRIPVIYKDFISLVDTYALPYLDPIRLLPQSLTRHLTKHAKQALTPHRAPTPILLHTITSRLSRRCFEHYGIFTPELNAAPILWRTVRYMGGTPSLYAISKVLARYLELPLMLSAAMAPPLIQQTEKDPMLLKSDNIPPELALVATVVIALKLVYSFDGKQITPKEEWDPGHTMPALEVYLDHLRALDASDTENSRKSFSSSSLTVGDMQCDDEEGLDAYFDFCERALLSRIGCDSKAGVNDDLVANKFPLERGMEVDERAESIKKGGLGTNYNRYDDVRPVLAATHVLGDASETSLKMVRAGESYTIYKGRDVFGRVPEKYAIVENRARQWSCVSGVDNLSRIIERFERRLVRRWRKSSRLREQVEDETDVESNGSK